MITADTITDEQLKELQAMATSYQDHKLVDLCRLALGMIPVLAWNLTPYGAKIKCAARLNAKGTNQ